MPGLVRYNFCLTMAKRGRKVEGVFGNFVDPKKPGALNQACQRVLGEEAPSHATMYRYFDLGWAETLPTESGSRGTHPDWANYDGKCPPVTHQMSVAASARSFAALRHEQGYVTRNGRAADLHHAEDASSRRR